MDFVISLLAKLSFVSDGVEDNLVLGSEVSQKLMLEFVKLVGLELVNVSSGSGVKDDDLFLGWDWNVLLLLEDFSQFLSSVKLGLGGGIEVRSELGESSDFSVLGKLNLDGWSNLLHGLNLGGRSDSGHRKTDVNGWSHSLVEGFLLQENLTIGNGDDIGWDISGHITSLGLNDWEGSKGSTSVVHVHLGCSLQKSGVKIEDISWVSLSSGWSSQKKRHLSVGDGLLGKIVIDNQSVLSVVSEVFSNGASRVWGHVLKWGGLGGSGSNNNGVLEGIVSLEDSDDVGDSGSLLSNSNINAIKSSEWIDGEIVEGLLLVDDGVNSDGSLSSLSVTNDKLSLSSSNWDQGIDGLNSSLHRLVDGLSWDNTWGLKFNSLSLISSNWTFSVNWVSKGIDDSSEHTFSDSNIDDGSSSLDNISLLDSSIVTKDDNTNVVSLKIKGHTLDS